MIFRTRSQWVFLFCCSIFSAQAYAGGPSDWGKFEIKGVKLGDPLSKIEKLGFKSGEYGVSISKDHRHYIKIFDACAAKGECKVAGRNDTVVVKNGQRADSAQNPVEYVDVEVTTLDLAEPRVEAINYYFPRQFLKEDSPLGKALRAKYGEHCSDTAECYRDDVFDKEGGGKMMFKSSSDNPILTAYCFPDSLGGVITKQCRIFTDDSVIWDQDMEKRRQLEQKQGEKNQPKAPEL